MQIPSSMTLAPRAAVRIVLVLVLASAPVGCASIWGFDDLTSAGRDGDTPIATEGGGPLDDGEAAAPADGGPAVDDGPSDSSLSQGEDARPASRRDAGDGGRPSDAALDADADDGAAMAQCMAICAGCCDSQGMCQGGTVVSACGTGGSACLNCPVAKKCTILTQSSCCTSNACTCATICL